MSDRTKALIAIIAASLLWSSAGISKVVVRTFDPFTAGFLRYLIASLVILPFFLKEKRERNIDWTKLLPLSLLSGVNVGLFYIGLQSSSANAATMIYAGAPIVTALLARQFIAERINIQKIIGLLVGLGGVLMITLLPTLETGQNLSGDLRGNLFYLLAVIVWAVYSIGSQKASATHNQSPITISGLSIFSSCLLFGVITLFSWKPSYLPRVMEDGLWLTFLHLGIFVTVAPLLLYQWTIKLSSATTASLTTYLQPVSGVIFNMIFLGEQLTANFVLGGIVIIVGVAIATGERFFSEIRLWRKRTK
ncbi:MAG: DMT family transporter [Patescibacteria group bacterium]